MKCRPLIGAKVLTPSPPPEFNTHTHTHTHTLNWEFALLRTRPVGTSRFIPGRAEYLADVLDWQALGEGLSTHEHITDLNLADNPIRSDGLEALCKAMAHCNCPLKRLTITTCQVLVLSVWCLVFGV
jgi:hypothetical protein